MAVGKYNVTVINYGDENHTSSSDSLLFNVTKADSSIAVNPIGNVSYGGFADIGFTGENLTVVNVTVYDADKNIIFTDNTTSTDVTLSDILPLGVYNVTVINYGDENHTGSSDSVLFNIVKGASSISLSPIADVVYGGAVVVEFSAVNGTSFNVTVCDASGNVVFTQNVTESGFTVPVSLTAGQYNATVINYGDENHTSSSDSVLFNVTKAASIVNISPLDNIIYLDEFTVTWSGENLTGKYHVKIYNDTETIIDENVDEASLREFAEFNVGKYSLRVTNMENQNYTASNATIALEIIPRDNNVRVEVDNVTYGEITLIRVYAEAPEHIVLILWFYRIG